MQRARDSVGCKETMGLSCYQSESNEWGGEDN